MTMTIFSHSGHYFSLLLLFSMRIILNVIYVTFGVSIFDTLFLVPLYFFFTSLFVYMYVCTGQAVFLFYSVFLAFCKMIYISIIELKWRCLYLSTSINVWTEFLCHWCIFWMVFPTTFDVIFREIKILNQNLSGH